MGERRGAYRIWVGNPKGKRLFGRPRLRWIFRTWDVGEWSGLI
jgi:hypothetical protein